MNFKLDENLPASAASKLTDAGHDVDTVVDENLAGAPDPDVVSPRRTEASKHDQADERPDRDSNAGPTA